jgi:hypothetical protein
MPEATDTPSDSLNVGEHPVGLRLDEVVHVNENRHGPNLDVEVEFHYVDAEHDILC